MSLRDEVISDAHSKESKICPIHCVKVLPAFNVAVDESSNEKVHHESYRLEHQCTLAECQAERFLVVAQVRADNGDNHEKRDDAVESRSDNGIVESLSKSMLLRRVQSKMVGVGDGNEGNQEEGTQEPANNGDWLRNDKGNSTSHIQE